MRGMLIELDHKRRHVERLERSNFEAVEYHTRHCLKIEPAIQTNAFITLRSDTLLALTFFAQLRFYLQHVRKLDKHQQRW
jgi:hypothetical protein